MHIAHVITYTNDEVNTTFVNIENKLTGGPKKI